MPRAKRYWIPGCVWNKRDHKWSRAIAVGIENYIEHIKKTGDEGNKKWGQVDNSVLSK